MKPRPDFPLFPHRNGQWAKNVRGTIHYFGVWGDPEAALQKYLDQKDDLQAGRKPRGGSENGPEFADLLDEFLVAKRHLVETGELSIRSFKDYHLTCDRIVAAFGAKRLVAVLRSDGLWHCGPRSPRRAGRSPSPTRSAASASRSIRLRRRPARTASAVRPGLQLPFGAGAGVPSDTATRSAGKTAENSAVQ